MWRVCNRTNLSQKIPSKWTKSITLTWIELKAHLITNLLKFRTFHWFYIRKCFALSIQQNLTLQKREKLIRSLNCIYDSLIIIKFWIKNFKCSFNWKMLKYMYPFSRRKIALEFRYWISISELKSSQGPRSNQTICGFPFRENTKKGNGDKNWIQWGKVFYQRKLENGAFFKAFKDLTH